MKTRIFTLLVAFLTIAGNAVWGQETSWTGQGKGTADDPYQISTPDELKAFRDLVNGGDADACAKLTDNIELDSSEEWEPIYYCSEEGMTAVLSYTGTFDGNNKTIKGLNIGKDPKNYAIALFGAIGVIKMNFSGSMETEHIGEVKDLTVEGSFNKDLTTTAGGICGYNAGTIRNCVSNISTSDFNWGTKGGISAYNLGTITKCINKGDIKTKSGAGGICGINRGDGIIEQCYNEGSIQGEETEANVGGICGNVGYGNPVIKNCYNVGELTSGRLVSGICCVPSLDGGYKTHATITNCHNYGIITSTGGAHQAGICTVYEDDNIEVTASNNYYLESVAKAGFVYTTYSDETPNDQPSQTEPKSADAFANGEVLYLLQQNNPGVWKQGELYPVFLGEEEEETTIYQVTFDYNYEGSPEAITEYVEAGEAVTVPTLTREGYTFTNWSTDAAGESVAEISSSVTPDASVTYYAQWQEEQTEDPDEGDDDEQGGIVPDAPKYYNIYEDEICEGVTVEFSRDVVKEGQSVLVTITVDEEFDATDLTLKFKRSLFGYWEDLTLTPTENPGEYIIENIYTDIYVRAEGAVPTGIEEVTGAKVYTKDGSIYVYTPAEEEVQIISVSGAVLKNEQQVGLKQYTGLQRGIYIICIDEVRFKVRL